VAADSRIDLQVLIAARPETVYRFLSDPARFRAWMGDGAALGADQSLCVNYPTGEVAEGRVLEMVEGTRLVFSYGYRDHPLMGPGSTTVRIELIAEGEGTRVVFTHEGLPDRDSAGAHEGGWRHYLSRLRNAVLQERLGPGVESTIDAYLAAWNETDPARRAVLLEQCWSENGLFADFMGSAEGRAGLEAYIAAAQRFMPGARLERIGPPALVLDRARVAWRATRPDGAPLAQGVNFVELGADGRIVRLSGFWEGAATG
jgi:uncharacterized protein YndB with AHSA1/START domain